MHASLRKKELNSGRFFLWDWWLDSGELAMSDLTVRQLAFVEAYSADGNAARAARVAGYAEKSAKVMACRLTKDNRIAAEIAKRRAANAEQFQITKDDVLAGFLSAIHMAREQQNPGAMISGLVQIAKMLGFYDPERISVALSGDAERLRAKFESLSDEELLAIASARQP